MRFVIYDYHFSTFKRCLITNEYMKTQHSLFQDKAMLSHQVQFRLWPLLSFLANKQLLLHVNVYKI